MKPKRHGRVRCSAWLGGNDMARLIILTRRVTQAQMALQRVLIRLERHYGCLAKWFVIERAAASGANVRLLVKPSQATTDLMAAAQTLCSDKHGIRRTARVQKLLDVLRCDEWLIAHKCALPPNDPSSATAAEKRND